MNRYSQGVLYVWTMPDNFTDLYTLPPEVTGAIKNFVMRGFPARLDGPAQVALFAYDNRTFIVESFLPEATDVKISVLDGAGPVRLKNLVSGEILESQSSRHMGWTTQNRVAEDRVAFKVHLPPHSYAVFSVNQTVQTSSP